MRLPCWLAFAVGSAVPASSSARAPASPRHTTIAGLAFEPCQLPRPDPLSQLRPGGGRAEPRLLARRANAPWRGHHTQRRPSASAALGAKRLDLAAAAEATASPSGPMSSPVKPSLTTAVPRHVALIPDGNGRWAAARGLPRSVGHAAGAQRVREVGLGALPSQDPPSTLPLPPPPLSVPSSIRAQE